MVLSYSFVIPVYNRPVEIRELLESLTRQTYDRPFEVVVVEDGSTISSDVVIKEFAAELDISYFQKKNSGPGDSRNYGMSRAKGNYFIILDSDCLLPNGYLSSVDESLNKDFVHCYGGPDTAHESFTKVQKAINYAMTSFLTTGGIRGRKDSINKFQPRSFNMGISKEAFSKVGGYRNIHPGEDPDLTIRLWNHGYETKLIPEAYVYHKRRIDWKKFYIQVRKFGMVRPILNHWYPETAKITYWFPTLFCLGFIIAAILLLKGTWWPMALYGCYLLLLFLDAWAKTKNFNIALMAVFAAMVQFVGYGFGFLKSVVYINLSRKSPQSLFPKLFFRTNNT